MKKILFLLFVLVIGMGNVYADLIVNPPRECSTDGKLIDCPNIRYYGKDINKQKIKSKENRPQKVKQHKFKFFRNLLGNAAYADEIPVQDNYYDRKTRNIFSIILLILVISAVISVRKSIKGEKDDDKQG